MRRPLGTSAARMDQAPFLLVDLETEEGVTGRAHAFCYMDIAAPVMRRVIDIAGELIAGVAVEPDRIERTCRGRFRLLGTPGVVGMALSALDVACWDALSRAADQPLAHYLGGTAEVIPAYNSNGLGLTAPDRLGEEACSLLDDGFSAVKLRLGREDGDADLKAVRAVRNAVPPGTIVMADYNQALTIEQAIERGRALEDEDIYWIEEPVAHDDLQGCARVADALRLPVQIGENFCGSDVMATAIAVGAADRVMPDLMRIGGVTGWLRASVLAQDASLPMSSHLYPEVSVHLLAATPTAHWLEYVDWAEPILQEPVAISGSMAQVPSGTGTGVAWNEAAVARYALD